jgi:flagellar biosynthesis protein FliQ
MNETKGSSMGRRAIAALVLLVTAWILLKFVVGIAIAIASGVVLVGAVVALLWALNTLL